VQSATATGVALRLPAVLALWVAVRHDVPGAEHVHIVATLATEAGRAAAGGAQDVQGFLARLRDVGLVVKQRRSERDGALTGCAVALPGRDGGGRRAGVLLRRQARRPHLA